MRNILHEIVERKRDDAPETVPDTRGDAVRPFVTPDRFALIAEVKKASPSKGTFTPRRDPVALAEAYERGGASAISVLTERNYFLGSLGDLQDVRGAVALPALRKDFLTTAEQIDEAHRAGADAVLLIVAVLRDELGAMLAAAREIGVAALTEVHDDAELDTALAAGADLLGINNRNLETFEVDLETCYRLKRRIPDDVPVIAESGFSTPDEVVRLRDHGFAGALIGESLVRSGDPEASLRAMRTALGETTS